jgi:hypothetical protein
VVLTALAVRAAAQQGAASAVPAMPSESAAASASLSQFSSLTNTQTDVVFGRNLKGPYLLSWKGIRPASETVLRNGLTQLREIDYTFDAEKGTLTFTTPLRADEIARVSYRTDTPTAVPDNAVIVPQQFDLWQSGQNRLSIQTIYQPDTTDSRAAKGAGDTALSALQLVTQTRLLKSSDLTSGLYLNLNGGSLLERSGLRLAEHTRLRAADLTVSYARAGAQFSQGDVPGLKAGKEVMEAAGTVNLNRMAVVGATLRQMTDLPDTTQAPDGGSPPKGTTTREVGTTFALTLPKNGGKVEAGRAITQTVAPDGSAVESTQDSVKVEKTLSKSTVATLSYAATATSPLGQAAGGTYDQATSVEVRTRPVDQVQLDGTFRNGLGTAGAQDTVGMKMEATPLARLRQLKLTTNWEDRFEADGVRRLREALMELPTFGFGRTQLSGGVRQQSAPGQDRLTGLVDAKSQPLRYVQLSGGVRLRDERLADASDPDAVNTYNMKMALAPSNRLRLTGSVTRNPESDDGTIRKVQAHTVGLETAIGSLSLRGQYGIEMGTLDDQQKNTMEVALALRLTPWDTLTTGFQGSSTLDSSLTATVAYLLTYTHRLGQVFDLSLSGSMTQRDVNGAADPNGSELKAEASLGLRF